MRRRETRKPEDVKLRTADEHMASASLQEPARESSLEARVQGLEDFEFIGMLGQGAYGKVFMARKKKGGKLYAIKVISKQKIMQEKKQHEIFRERQALITLDHPNIVKMYWSFNVKKQLFNLIQDKKNLYFVLDLAPNGELYTVIKREGKLKYETARFLAAEIVTILEYMHSMGVSHRDLKPSNLLLDENLHLKLVDFGTAKIQEKKRESTVRKTICVEMQEKKDKMIDHDNNSQPQINKPKGTVVGTEDYIAPEVLAAEVSGPPADLWSFGVIVYMMLTGSSPFKGHTQYLTFKNISEGKYSFPVNDPNFPEEARDFIMRLLKKDPHDRLGAGYEGSDNDY